MKVTLNIPDEFIEILADAIAKRVLGISSSNTEPARQRWLTHKEAASYIRATPATLYKLTSTRAIKYRKKGKSNIYNIDDLENWLESGAIETANEIITGLALTPRRKHSLNQK